MQSDIVRQLIWHQIKLQMYKISTWCRDDGVSLGRLLCKVFHHRRLELRDGGDLHLLRGGVLAFDGLQERTVWVRNLENCGRDLKTQLPVHLPSVLSAPRSL